MRRPRFLSAAEAVALIPDAATIGSSGFVGSGHPETLSRALEERFLATGTPRGLTLIYAAGQGDGGNRGLNHLGHEGLVRRVIGGHWNLVPRLGALATANRIEAYNLPQGVISRLFREVATGNPGVISRIGLDTFVDPRLGGGRMNARTTADIVEVITLGGVETLFYCSHPIHVALLRGTSSDSFGNISFENEAITGEVLSIAQAARNSGGVVLMQVERIVADHSRDPKSIRVPGIFVDAVVLAAAGEHPQTYATAFDPAFVRQGPLESLTLPPIEPGPRRWIAARCLEEIRDGDVVNLGIGMAEGIAQVAFERGMLDRFTLTVEAGAIGGVPAGGLSFGTSSLPQAIIDQPNMFDFYDGGGLDVAFLSMAECDRMGNVNVSRYGGRIPGSGGFINIAQSAKRLVFLGTFTAGGLEARFDGGRLILEREGASRKFVERVEQITFSPRRAIEQGREILYVTERAVFTLSAAGLELIEIAPGVDPERDLFPQMGFRPAISPVLRPMSATVFG